MVKKIKNEEIKSKKYDEIGTQSNPLQSSKYLPVDSNERGGTVEKIQGDRIHLKTTNMGLGSSNNSVIVSSKNPMSSSLGYETVPIWSQEKVS